jgi:DNA invertase Pin-like site-specific DNA recombinase
MALIGYARISTDDGRQTTLRQLDELRAAGCAEILEEHASGADRARPVLNRLLAGLEPGTTVCVVKLDRLARSTRDLLDIVDTIEKAGAHLRVLGDPIDTSTPVGRFFLTLLGAFAEFELSTIREHTRSGLRAAKARGRVGGNPALRQRDPDAIRRMAEARKDGHRAELAAGASAWLPRVRQLRGMGWTWKEVARALNAAAAGAPRWTTERLVRSVRTLAAEGLAEAELLKPAPRERPMHNLVDVVAGIAGATPRPTLTEIAARLEAMRIRTARGGTTWSTSSVASLIGRAERLGMLAAGEEGHHRPGRPRRRDSPRP